MPAEIIEAVEAIWQRALGLAAQSATHEDNAAREQLAQIRIENEVRAQSFEMRESAYELAARERERALADCRDHLLSTFRVLETDRAPLKAREARIEDLEAQVENYRRQLATLITRALGRNRAAVERKRRRTTRARAKRPTKPRGVLKTSKRKPKTKHRSKR